MASSWTGKDPVQDYVGACALQLKDYPENTGSDGKSGGSSISLDILNKSLSDNSAAVNSFTISTHQERSASTISLYSANAALSGSDGKL